MNAIRNALCLAPLLLAGCGSVQLPEQHYYRLDLPDPAQESAPRAGTLRVTSLELSADLAGDRLLVAEGPVQVSPFQHHHWAGPLDRLLADAFVTGLRRAGPFERVKDSLAGGHEDWQLSGRVLAFHLAPAEDGSWQGLATIDLELLDDEGRLVFRQEFSQGTKAAGTEPNEIVMALSGSVDALVTDFVLFCDEVGVFEQPWAASPWR